MRRAAKVDANHGEIVSALRSAGCFVQSLATVGNGCPDLLVSRAGAIHLIEVKELGGRLTPAQKKWHAEWSAKAHVAYTVDDALLIVGAR